MVRDYWLLLKIVLTPSRNNDCTEIGEYHVKHLFIIIYLLIYFLHKGSKWQCCDQIQHSGGESTFFWDKYWEPLTMSLWIFFSHRHRAKYFRIVRGAAIMTQKCFWGDVCIIQFFSLRKGYHKRQRIDWKKIAKITCV